MKSTDVSLEEWKALYKAAKEFGDIKPWEWMIETDIFGVQNPLTGEVGYCCVMGELGEVLAMAVYLGTEGLQGYRNIITGFAQEDPDLMFDQDCLMVSFEDRDDLEKEDMAFIRKMGLKFSGKRAWPLFRRYEPGYFPSSLGSEDVRYLTVVLQQAKDVCLRIKKDEELLNSPEKNLYLVRVHGSSENWEDAWIEPSPVKKTFATTQLDEFRIQKVKKIAKTSPAVWEVDFFYAPTPIEAERPYYPYAIMIADSGSGFIHDMQLSDRSEYSVAFPACFLACLENNAMAPSEILVRREEVFELLQPFTMKLNIKLNMVRGLPSIDNARRSMTKHFQGGGPLPGEYCGDDIMEDYLEMAGAKLSIFGLYGLFYGCHASRDLFKPSEFISLIFGEEGARFETDEEAQLTMGNIMALWDLIGQWDPETEDLMIPECAYDVDTEGLMHRTYDALALATFFIQGLEFGGVTFEYLMGEMKEDAESFAKITKVLYGYAELLKEEKKHAPEKLEEVLKAIGDSEDIIDRCIVTITIGLKEVRLHALEQFSTSAKSGQTGFQTANVKIGRNDPCPCRSGKKYKKCCGILH